LFFNNLVAPDRRVFLREQPEAPDGRRDRAQVMVDLADLPDGVDRIIVTLSTLTEGATLSALRSLRIRAVDTATGDEKAAYKMGRELAVETCLIISEIYRHQGNWKLRAIGQGYLDGLSGLSSDFGVNLA
jgi:stress response protein SCP2